MKYYKVEKLVFDILMKMQEEITMGDLKKYGISKENGFLIYILYQDWKNKRLQEIT
jgi:hypothetical protein